MLLRALAALAGSLSAPWTSMPAVGLVITLLHALRVPLPAFLVYDEDFRYELVQRQLQAYLVGGQLLGVGVLVSLVAGLLVGAITALVAAAVAFALASRLAYLAIVPAAVAAALTAMIAGALVGAS